MTLLRGRRTGSTQPSPSPSLPLLSSAHSTLIGRPEAALFGSAAAAAFLGTMDV